MDIALLQVKFTGDTSSMDRAFASASRSAYAFKAEVSPLTNISFDADVSGFVSGMQAASAAASDMRASVIEEFRRVRISASSGATFGVSAETYGFDGAYAAVAALRAAANERTTAVVDTSVRGVAEGVTQLGLFDAAAHRVDGQNATVTGRVNGVAAGIGELGALDVAAKNVDGKTVSIKGQVDQNIASVMPTMLGDMIHRMLELESVQAAISAFSIPAMMAGFGGLVSTGFAATGQIAALAVGLGQGLAGAAGIAGGAIGIGGAALGIYGAALGFAGSQAFFLSEKLDQQTGKVASAEVALLKKRDALAKTTEGTKEHAIAELELTAAEIKLENEQKKLDAMHAMMTPNILALSRAIGDTQVSFIQTAGAITEAAAPALLYFLNTGNTLLPQLVPHVVDMVTEMNNLSMGFLDAALQGQNLSSIETILFAIKAAAEPALTIVLNIGMTLVNVLAGVMPYSLLLLDTMANLTTRAYEWSQSVQGQTTIGETWAFLAGRAVVLWDIASNLAVGLYNVGAALQASGAVDAVLYGFQALAIAFADVTTQGNSGYDAIVNFMTAAQPVLSAAWSLAGELATQIGHVAYGILTATDEATGMNILVEIIDAIKAAAEPLGNLLVQNFTDIGPVIARLIPEIAQFMETFIGATPALVTLGGAIADVLHWFNGLDPATQAMVASAITMASIFNQLGGSIVPGLGGSLGGLVSNWFLLKNAQAAVVAAGGTPVTLFGTIKTAATGLATGLKFVGSGFVSVATALGGALLTAGRAVLGFIPTLWTAFVAGGPVVWAIVAAVVAFAGIAYLIYSNWETIGPWLSALWTSIYGAIASALSSIWGAIQWAWGGIVSLTQLSWTDVWNAISGAWSYIYSTIAGWLSYIWTGIQAAWDYVYQGAVTAWNYVWSAISAAWSYIYDTIAGWLSYIYEGVVASWTMVWSAISAAWSYIYDTIAGWLSYIWEGISAAWSYIYDTIAGWLSYIYESNVSSWTMIWEAISSTWSYIYDTVSGWLSYVWDIVSVTWDSVWSTTVSAWDYIWSTIESAWSYIYDTVAGWSDYAWTQIDYVWNSIWSFFIYLWDGVSYVFSSVLDWLGSYLSDSWYAQWDLIDYVWNSIWDFFSYLWDGVSYVFSSVLDWLGSYLSDSWYAQWDLIDYVWNSIWDFFSYLWDGVSGLFSSALDWLGSYLSDSWYAQWDLIDYVWNAVWDFFDSIWTSISDTVGYYVDGLVDAVYDGMYAIWEWAESGGEWLYNSLDSWFGDAVGVAAKFLGDLLYAASYVLDAIGATSLAGSLSDLSSWLYTFETGGVVYWRNGGVQGDDLVMQAAFGGVADGRTPRAVYGEGGSPEAYIVKDRSTSEQLPYLQTAAGWHGFTLTPTTGGPRPAAERQYFAARTLGDARYRQARGGVIGNPAVSGVGEGLADTHWNVMPYIQGYADAISSSWGASWNTYYGHGEPGGSSEEYTVDFWGPGGRGDAIAYGTGQGISSEVLQSYVDDLMYMIWYGYMYFPSGSTAWPDDPHYDHVHVSWGSSVYGQHGLAGGGGFSWAAALAAVRSLWDRAVPSVPDIGLGMIGDGVEEWAGDLPKQVFDWMVEKAKTYIMSWFGVGSGGSGDTAQVTEWVKEGLVLGNALGTDDDTVAAMVSRAMQESSGDPNAVNNWDSNALQGIPSKGLFQIVAPTWATWQAAYGSDVGSFDDNWNDPVKSAAVASRYMYGYYGSVQGATGVGYALGGVIPGLAGSPSLALAHAGERILSARQNDSFETLVNLLDSSPAVVPVASGAGSITGTGDVYEGDIVIDIGDIHIGGGSLDNPEQAARDFRDAVVSEMLDAAREGFVSGNRESSGAR